MLDQVLLQRSDSGEICLFESRDRFHASFKNGQWVNDLLFQDYELEDFNLIYDEEEIEVTLAEARAALGQPLNEAKAG